MALQQYWQIIWKRIWILIFLLVFVGGLSFLTYQAPLPTYSISMSFTVAVKPQEVKDQYNYDGYYAWISSEYLVDNLTKIVESDDFISSVNNRLRQMGDMTTIHSGTISADREHRILHLNVRWGNPDELRVIGQAIMRAVEEDSIKYFPQLDESKAPIKIIDGPTLPTASPSSLTQRLELPIRLILALVAGIGLVFLLDYLDTSIRNGPELEAMGISVLAEVPKHK